MRAEEMMCLAILPEDLVVGIGYARQSLHHTFDRMQFGDNEHRRFYNIALGKTCEATLVRFLRQHGIPHLSRQGATPHTQPDHFDLRVLQEIVDLKTFKVPKDIATPNRLLDCLALVPDHHARDPGRAAIATKLSLELREAYEGLLTYLASVSSG